MMSEDSKASPSMPNDQAEQDRSDLDASDEEEFVFADNLDQRGIEQGGDDDGPCVDHPSADQSNEAKSRLGWRTSPENLFRRLNVRRSTNSCRSASRCLPLQKEPKICDDDEVRIPPREELGWQGLALASGEAFSAVVNWLQRRPFLAVVGLFLIVYLISVTLFVFLLFMAINLYYDNRKEMCCEGYDFDINTISNNYFVVFDLSWTVSDSGCDWVLFTMFADI